MNILGVLGGAAKMAMFAKRFIRQGTLRWGFPFYVHHLGNKRKYDGPDILSFALKQDQHSTLQWYFFIMSTAYQVLFISGPFRYGIWPGSWSA